MTRDNTILVTGGAGYVGSVLVRALLLEGYRVHCLDTLRFGGAGLTAMWGHPGFTFSKVDITQPAEVDPILAAGKAAAVVHLAAIVGDPACKLEPELATKTNLEASHHLLDAAMRSGIPRFVFASTCSNYGKMADAGGFVDETSPLAPVSLYAELKVAFETLMLKELKRVDSFAPTALRFATVFGMSPRMRFDLTVNEFTKEMALGRELVVFGEQFWRPYCHVNDFARAIIAVLRAPREAVAYNVFNVGATGQNYTKKMIVDEILKQVPGGRVKYVRREDDPRDYRVNFDRISTVLGFQTSRTVPEGIHEVFSAIAHGIIEDPDEQRYYNIPI